MANIRSAAGNGEVRRDWRELGQLALASLAAGLIASLVLALAVFIISFDAHAAGTADAGQGTPAGPVRYVVVAEAT